jgi:nucleoside-diphosphate-sugar epimerase
MKVLVIGGGGHVGGIIRPALEKEHQVRYLDLKPVPGADSIVGSVTDPVLVKHAVEGMEGIVYLAMGGFIKGQGAIVPAAFDVNVQGLYLFLYAAGVAQIRHFVYASTMSIYRNHRIVKDESEPANSWEVYGLTKGLGEVVCERAALQYPDMCIVAPRMIVPHTDEGWLKHTSDKASYSTTYPLGPNDTRRLYLAALACNKPGAHLLQTTGDVNQTQHSYARAKEIIGWSPQGD